MTDTVKVLVWGTAEQGPCAYFRGHLFDEPLKKLGVELRHFTNVNFKPGGKYAHECDGESCRRCADAILNGAMELDKSEIEWADVVMFRRYYNTSMKCRLDGDDAGCGFVTLDRAEAEAHPHGFALQDGITRTLWPLFRDSWSGGIVYETDDDHYEIKPWNGFYRSVLLERALITDMARRADVLTVATPALTASYGKYNPRIRVVRNAIDPDLYVRDTDRPAGDKARLVYYGSTARLRDYAGSPDDRGKWRGGYAQAAVKAHRKDLHTVFLGANKGTEEVIAGFFDEQHPYIENIPAFSKALANAHGDIGIAPLGGDDFDRSKSELHWLEYAMSDMAFVGQRYRGEGPYQVIREGVDGLLARGSQEWHDAIGKLARSKDLRDDLAGRAKERVLAEYDYRVRAEEWADAFRFAAENPGIGKRQLAAA